MRIGVLGYGGDDGDLSAEVDGSRRDQVLFAEYMMNGAPESDRRGRWSFGKYFTWNGRSC